MNYYHILGLSQSATPQEVKKKFRQLAKQHHPDKGGNDLYFQKINEAYQILSDNKKRANYDFMIKNPHSFYTPSTPQKQKKKQKDPQEPIRAKRYDEFTEKEKEDWKKKHKKEEKPTSFWESSRKEKKQFLSETLISVILFFGLIIFCVFYELKIGIDEIIDFFNE
ncbi:MAG: DnaJ domain-containing protein [Cytophagales bacterium]|nr:DnaJ domain-containing protein [Cytophagales bacterium]